jgi:hypothetical protein
MVTATATVTYLGGQVANLLGAALTHPFVTGVSGSVLAQQTTSAKSFLDDIGAKLWGLVKDIVSPLCFVVLIVAGLLYFFAPFSRELKSRAVETLKTVFIFLLVFAFAPQILGIIFGIVSALGGTNITAPTLK